MPATFLLNYLFMGWLHKPELAFIREAEKSKTRGVAAQSAVGTPSPDQPDGTKDMETLPAEAAIGPHGLVPTAVHRRPVRQAARVYACALLVGLLCLLVIASVTRLFTPELTVEWLKVLAQAHVGRCLSTNTKIAGQTTAVSVVFKWCVTDPLRTVVFTRIWLWLHKVSAELADFGAWLLISLCRRATSMMAGPRRTGGGGRCSAPCGLCPPAAYLRHLRNTRIGGSRRSTSSRQSSTSRTRFCETVRFSKGP